MDTGRLGEAPYGARLHVTYVDVNTNAVAMTVDQIEALRKSIRTAQEASDRSAVLFSAAASVAATGLFSADRLTAFEWFVGAMALAVFVYLGHKDRQAVRREQAERQRAWEQAVHQAEEVPYQPSLFPVDGSLHEFPPGHQAGTGRHTS